MNENTINDSSNVIKIRIWRISQLKIYIYNDNMIIIYLKHKRCNTHEYHSWGLFDINNKPTLHGLDNS